MAQFFRAGARQSAVPSVLSRFSTFSKPSSLLSSNIATASATAPSAASIISPSANQVLTKYPITQVTTLSNGLRVASEPGYGETATVGVWINTGSRYEDEKTNGVAHFLEHMFFKGTSKRTRQALEQEVENIGGHLNAYTSREQTVFYAKVFKQDVPQAMDILSDIITNSKIEEDAVNRERDTILREMKEVDSQLEEVIFDKLHYTAYRGTALGRTILGSEQNIQSITREDIKNYVETHYTAPRIVIAGAGAVDHGQLVSLTEKLFNKIPASPTGGRQPFKEPARFTGSDIRIRFDDMPMAHVAYGFPTGGWKDADNFSLMLIQTLLGSWDKRIHGGVHSSSWLIRQVAQNEVAQSITTFNTQYSDTGLFGIYGVAGATNLNNLAYCFTRALTELCYRVDDDLLAEAKNQLKMNMLAHLDGSTVICEDIGRQLLTYGRRMHPVEVLQRIDAVDANAIKLTARRYFHDRDHALSAIGPIWELPDYNWIRTRSYFGTI